MSNDNASAKFKVGDWICYGWRRKGKPRLGRVLPRENVPYIKIHSLSKGTDTAWCLGLTPCYEFVLPDNPATWQTVARFHGVTLTEKEIEEALAQRKKI